VTRITRETIAYLVISGFCILMFVWAIPTYTPAYPGYGASPALVPNVAVGVILFMACLSLVRIGLAVYLKKPMPPEECEFPEDLKEEGGFTQVGRVNLYHLARFMIPPILLIVVIDYIGYLLASFIFLLTVQYVIGCRKWMQLTVVAVTLTLVLYVVMRYGFGVPIPGPQIF